MFVQKPLEKLDFLMKNCLFNKMKSDKSNNIFSKRREVGSLSEGLLVSSNIYYAEWDEN